MPQNPTPHLNPNNPHDAAIIAAIKVLQATEHPRPTGNRRMYHGGLPLPFGKGNPQWFADTVDYAVGWLITHHAGPETRVQYVDVPTEQLEWDGPNGIFHSTQELPAELSDQRKVLEPQPPELLKYHAKNIQQLASQATHQASSNLQDVTGGTTPSAAAPSSSPGSSDGGSSSSSPASPASPSTGSPSAPQSNPFAGMFGSQVVSAHGNLNQVAPSAPPAAPAPPAPAPAGGGQQPPVSPPNQPPSGGNNQPPPPNQPPAPGGGNNAQNNSLQNLFSSITIAANQAMQGHVGGTQAAQQPRQRLPRRPRATQGGRFGRMARVGLRRATRHLGGFYQGLRNPARMAASPQRTLGGHMRAATGQAMLALQGQGGGGGIGNMLGAAGTVAGALPGIGPVVAAGFALSKALADSVVAIQGWTHSLHDANMHFAEFSASMAAVRAQQEARSMQLSHERGERLAPSAQFLAEGMNDLDRAMAPLEDMWMEIKNSIGGTLGRDLAEILKMASAILRTKSNKNDDRSDLTDFNNALASGEDLSRFNQPERFQGATTADKTRKAVGVIGATAISPLIGIFGDVFGAITRNDE